MVSHTIQVSYRHLFSRLPIDLDKCCRWARVFTGANNSGKCHSMVKSVIAGQDFTLKHAVWQSVQSGSELTIISL